VSSDPTFELIDGSPDSPIVIHVPHSSTVIPPRVRERITLDDAALQSELQAMTDADTDQIAELASRGCPVRPWIFVNRLSRLVIDPERFPDPDDEPMAHPEIGMGAVYTRTADLRVLRMADTAHHNDLLTRYFHPYAAALTEAVDGRLRSLGRAIIIDLHSFPEIELPYEALHHGGADRPELCLGTDDFHTPISLIDSARQAFESMGRVSLDQPFAGTYVPLKHYRSDPRVMSIMIELRRDQYVRTASGTQAIADMLADFIDSVGSITGVDSC
jgi:N-formylglutamate deformylase